MTARITKAAGNVIFAVRWVLYPVNLALVAALCVYVVAFLYNDYHCQSAAMSPRSSSSSEP